MKENRKGAAIQAAAIVIAVLAAFAVILYARGAFDLTFIKRPETEPVSSESEPADTEPAAPDTDVTAESGDVTEPVTEPDDGPELPNYETERAGLTTAEQARSDGKRYLYRGLYDPETCVVAVVDFRTALPADYAVRDAQTRVISVETGGKGELFYTESYETAPRPVIAPYFGYVIYDDGRSLKLLAPDGRALVGDITAYVPTGYRDLSGHPLFKRDGLYYYYYDGASTTADTVVADRITAEDVWMYQRDVIPGAYADVDVTSEITPTLPESAGMVECTVDENYFNTVSVNSSYESRHGSPEIFRFCQHRIIRQVLNQPQIDARAAEIAAWTAGVAAGTVDPAVTPEPLPVEPLYEEEDQGFFWGYVNSEGNYVLEPQYERAYDFSTDGLAVVNDPDSPQSGRTVVINAQGGVVFNAYRTTFTNVEQGTLRVRDGHYLPDLYGPENVGMLAFDHSLLRVRRRVAAVSGGKVQSESSELVNASGKLFALPEGYELTGYSDGVALLEKDGLYGYMDYTGRWIVPPRLTVASPFSEGLAAAGHKGHVGLIDVRGETVVPMIFDRVSDCSDGVICAFSEGHGWTVLHKMSKSEYVEPSNPILQIKKRLLAEAAYAELYGTPETAQPAQ